MTEDNAIEHFSNLPIEEKLRIIAKEETQLRIVFAEYSAEQLEVTARRNRISLVGGRTVLIGRLVKLDLRRCYGSATTNWDSSVDGTGARESLTPSEITLIEPTNEVVE